jgi:hypothetical protein
MILRKLRSDVSARRGFKIKGGAQLGSVPTSQIECKPGAATYYIVKHSDD